MPSKDSSLSTLKKQLAQLQNKISDLENDKNDNFSVREVKELYSWVGPDRIFVARDKKWFINIALIALVMLVITLFLREFLLMGVILALMFVAYILATVPPQKVDHKITTQGIIIHRRSYLWEELADFWFTEKYGHEVLNIDTYLRFPGELVLVIKKEDRQLIRDILVKYLPFREVAQKSWLDRSTEWFTKKLSSL